MENPAEQNKRRKAATMQKISSFLKILSGPLGKNAIISILIKFMIIPLHPFPNITAPMYFSGNILASPYTYPWTIPFTAPNVKSIKKVVQNLTFSFPGLSEINGILMIKRLAIRKPI